MPSGGTLEKIFLLLLFLFEGNMQSWMFFLGEEKITIDFLNSLK